MGVAFLSFFFLFLSFFKFIYFNWRLSFFFLITYFILFLAVLSLHCYMWAFSSCSEHRLLSNCGVWTSHCGGFSCGVWVLEVWTQ